MKKCVVIHVNDGKPEELHNGDHMFIERFPRTERIIEEYLAKGYELKQMIPDYTPAMQEEGNFTFFKGGVTIYFEKHADEE